MVADVSRWLMWFAALVFLSFRTTELYSNISHILTILSIEGDTQEFLKSNTMSYLIVSKDNVLLPVVVVCRRGTPRHSSLRYPN